MELHKMEKNTQKSVTGMSTDVQIPIALIKQAETFQKQKTIVNYQGLARNYSPNKVLHAVFKQQKLYSDKKVFHASLQTPNETIVKSLGFV